MPFEHDCEGVIEWELFSSIDDRCGLLEVFFTDYDFVELSKGRTFRVEYKLNFFISNHWILRVCCLEIYNMTRSSDKEDSVCNH